MGQLNGRVWDFKFEDLRVRGSNPANRVLREILKWYTKSIVQSGPCDLSFVTWMDIKLLMQLWKQDEEKKLQSDASKDGRGPSQL